VLWLKASEPERHVHSLLDRYVARIEREVRRDPRDAARLATVVLQKRAASSAAALERTARRRIALLRAGPEPPVQPRLPLPGLLDDDAGEDVPDEWLRAPGLSNPRAECAWLGAIAEAARRAGRDDRRIAALRRLLRCTREPVVVFTEYRHTLEWAARHLRDLGPVEYLHGALSAAERQRALAAFTSGHARLLLATDAASEGLNLQRRCRTVVMLDLPWTPSRVEQRIGRVDRLGQLRRVHGLALASDTAFGRQLVARLARGRARMDAAFESSLAPGSDLEEDTGRALTRLATLRRITRAVERRSGSTVRPGRPRGAEAWFVTTVPRPRTRVEWSGALLIVELRLAVDGLSDADRTVLGLHLPVPVPRLDTAEDTRRFAGRHVLPLVPRALAWAHAHVQPRRAAAERDREAREALTVLVQRAAATRAATAARPVQQPLFGRYAAEGHLSASGAAPHELDDAATAVRAVRHEQVIALLLRTGPGTPPCAFGVEAALHSGRRAGAYPCEPS
jgi:hypothetical protein